MSEAETLPADSADSADSSPSMELDSDRRSQSSIIRSARIGRYVLLDRVGMGGMGLVYAAYDPQLDRKVAIKLVRPTTGETGPARLLREAQAMAKLSHPNVVTVHDVGTVDDQVFVAMEFVDGSSLRRWLTAEPRSWREILDTVIEAGRGLAAAHAHGLIHRDFKPDNVMIRRDRRVQVLDFGLVRAAPRDEHDSPDSFDPQLGPPSPGRLDDPLTKVGSVVGTPAYMAPEQISGGDADARSDQFSFCVTLYEALYGERPYSGSTVAEMAAAALRGDVQGEPRASTVPRRVRTLLVRGLSVRPSDRFETMDELLTELSRDPWRRRRAPIFMGTTAAVALATTAAGMTIARQQAERRAQACEAEGRAIDEIWNEQARTTLEQQFEHTGSPYAAASYERMTAWLDPWAARWAQERAATCRRARVDESLDLVRYEQSVSCFDEQRERLSAMLAVLSEPNVDMVPGAAKAAAKFSQLESCADERLLMQRPVLPDRLHGSPKRAEIRQQLARLSALLDAGDYKGGAVLAQEVVDAAVTVGWPPLEAEARLAKASMHSELGNYAEVVEELRTAFKLASASGSDPLAARVAIMLLRVMGYHLARAQEALVWADVAEALLERLGRIEDLDAAQLANNVALVHEVIGNYEESEFWHHEALALRQRVLGHDHPELGHSYANLGNIALSRDELDDALHWHQQALDVRKEGLGKGHPDVARSHSSIGRVHLARGELKEALDRFHRGYDILERNVGGRHRVAARVLDDIGKIHLKQGEPGVALGYFQKASYMQRVMLGEHHHETAQTTIDIGLALLAQGHTEEAFMHISEASDAFIAGLGKEHPFQGRVRDAMAELCTAGHWPACS